MHLADHITVQNVFDLEGLEQLAFLLAQLLLAPLFLHDVIAKLNAFVADVHRGACNDLLDVILRFATERAA